jgi:hypothetical protein
VGTDGLWKRQEMLQSSGIVGRGLDSL